MKSKFFKLSFDYEIKPFNCKDSELYDFLIEDSRSNLIERISTTYILEEDNKTVAYFSLLNDKISYKDTTNRAFTKVKEKLPHEKAKGSYPACKIGRLAVSEDRKGKGLGKQIINYIKLECLNNDFSACRFITVDSYLSAVSFYEKLGFKSLPAKTKDPTNTPPSESKEEETQLMYFDLKTIAP
jgi:GNAT superfamily N-acetyltransferase